MKDITVAILMWVALLLLRIPMILLGLVVVAVALPFAKVHSDSRAVVKWDDWKLVRLPKWAWPWDNLRDGAMGDVRGSYRYHQAPKFLINDFLRAYWWLAIRNPCNNFSRFMRPNSVDIRRLDITYIGDAVVDRTDKLKWHFVKGRGPVWTYFLFDLMVPAFGNRHLGIMCGHKISPESKDKLYLNDEQKYIKGFTIRMNLDSPTR